VVGWDRDERRLVRPELGAIGEVGVSLDDAVAGADLVIVAVPVGAIAMTVVAALDAGAAVVTDVGSVKAPVVTEVEKLRPDESARYVGGHPMAGSEQDGVDGADASLFVGSTWALAPSANTDERAYAVVLRVVRELGAEVVTLTPEHHDELVAFVSHVPQLAASTLMDVASATEDDLPTMRRLAAGGFRDMTRMRRATPASGPTSSRRTAGRAQRAGAYVAALLVPARSLNRGRDRADRVAWSGACGPPQPASGVSIADDLVEFGCPCRTAGCAGRGHDAGEPARRQHLRFRDRALARRRRVCSSSSSARGADAYEAGLVGSATTSRGDLA
jgi:prephenate dehydrogenase